MKHTSQAAGIVTILLAVWLRAERQMTANFTAFWGIAGMLLAAAGMHSLPAGRLSASDSGERRMFRALGAAILALGVAFSVVFSRLAMKNQELAVQCSLLLRENEQI